MKKSERRSTEDASPNNAVAELDGLVGLGMKRDALRLVRRHLNERPINPDTFRAAVNAILTLADACKPWRPLVEAAYQELPERGKRQARFMMLSFYTSLGDRETAYRFIPRRFTGPMRCVDLMFAVETLIALDRLDEAKALVRKATDTVDTLSLPEDRAMLMNSIAAYLSAVRDWVPAIRLWEGLQGDRLMAESAIFGLITLHLQWTLQTIKSARAALTHLRQKLDPELETTIPGNDAIRWRKTEAMLLKVERLANRGLEAAGSEQSH